MINKSYFDKLNRFMKTVISVIFIMLLTLTNFSFIEHKVVHAAESNEIILDYRRGNITIGNGTYSGYQVTYDEATDTYNGSSVSDASWTAGTHTFRIIQTDTNNQISNYLPIVMPSDIDVTDVELYEEKWDELAYEANRSPVSDYKIDITNTNSEVDITLQDIWSTYAIGSTSSARGGLAITGGKSNAGLNCIIRLKGDNRFTNIRYYTSYNTTKSHLTFTSADGDGKTSGTLTVCSDQDTYFSHSDHYKNKEGTASRAPLNHWNSVIGGSDSDQEVRGLVIKGGTIYAGSSKWENCTAIGAGGNGVGEVTIDGGKVTAVSYSTGTAIGGGIAHTGAGGQGYVTINGGEVYAYNYGQPFAETLSNYGHQQMKNTTKQYVVFVPGTAIGGAGSAHSDASKGTVTINGGTVYAESIGGSGIGGGNTVNGVGGAATVTINGGNVQSISKYGVVPAYKILGTSYPDYNIERGNGIGGGTSVRNIGGVGSVTINGGNVKANGIGGGNSTQKVGGDANVRINDGTIVADTIGGGFSNTYGYADGTVIVDGGSVNTTMAAIPTNSNGDMVYMTRLGVFDNTGSEAKNVQINSITGKNIAPEDYNLQHTFTDDFGMLYFYLPEDVVIQGIGDVSSGEYSPLDEPDGEIASKEVGKVVMTKGREHYLVNIVTSNYYNLYEDTSKLFALSTAQFVEKNTIYTFYIEPNKDENGNQYQVTPFYASTDSEGNKVFNSGELKDLGGGLYSVSINVSMDTQIWFSILVDPVNNESIFTLDLTNGNISITEDPANEKAIIIEQAGYTLSGYQGCLYLTSGGYPTSNSITVNAPERDVDLVIDKLIVSSAESPLKFKAGDISLSTSDSDDYIISTQSSAISIEEEASLRIYTEGLNSLKIYGADGKPAIEGKGSVNIADYGGFLFLNEDENTSSQLVVGAYLYESNEDGKMPYTAELYVGNFTFELIGYVKNNYLYDKSDSLAGNTENFYARGIYEVYSPNGIVTSSNKVVSNGNYSLTISSSNGNLEEPALRTYEGAVLVEGTDYTWTLNTGSTTVGQLVINGSAFTKGNIIIYANTYGVISYTSFDYEGVYDAYEHSIEVLVDSRYKVYYYKEAINHDNFNSLLSSNVLSLNPLQYSDVGEYTVYFYIIDTATSETKTPTFGSNKVVITKGVNAFNNKLTCSDVVRGNQPKPSISSKWGEVKYKYFDSNDNETTSFDELGTYYVKAYVEGNDNYDYIETDYRIRFEVFETNVYSQIGTSYDAINDLEENIKVPGNGSFTINYEFQADSTMYLMVKNGVDSNTYALSANTKILMIEFTGSNPVYYNYVISSSDLVTLDKNVYISLTNFTKMGTTNEHYSLSVGEQSNVQFSIMLNETTNKIINVNLGNASRTAIFENIIVEISNPEKASISINSIESVISNRMDVNFTINSDYTHQKVVTLSLFKLVGSEYVPFNIENMNLTIAGSNQAPKYYIDNKAIFNFGLGQATGLTYTVYFNNISDGNYKVEADITIIPSVYDDRYTLTNRISDSETFTLTSTSDPLLYVNEINDNRYFNTKDINLVFTISTNIQLSDISIEILQRNAATGEYTTYIESKTYSAANNRVSVSLSNLTSGVYRIKFETNGVVTYYNIIVDLA